jgi:hypothetical protein
MWPRVFSVLSERHSRGKIDLVNSRAMALLIVTWVWAGSVEAQSGLVIEHGTRPDGRPEKAWIDAVRVFNETESLREIGRTQRPWSEGESAWARLIEARAPDWPDLYSDLLIPFPDVEAPAQVRIILGNQGGNDAFVSGEDLIGFDLGRLLAAYGPASTNGNADRIDRFFAHEYTHILHKAWRRKADLVISTPLEQALWRCLAEGIGNYRSLSARWRDENRHLTPHAIETLERLQPIFTERIAKLESASDEEGVILMEGLSVGPFDQKWGALTVALWLAREAEDGDQKLAYWIERGPWGILDLAQKNLPADLSGRLPSMPSE